MQLMLQGIVPAHLQDRIKNLTSDVWGKSMTINAGEYVFIQAPSGTGKTTLIHLLYGLRNDYSGKAFWGRQEISNANDEVLSALRANNVSIIFQDMRLFPGLTTIENIEIKRLLTNSVTTEQVAGWMERLGISDKKNAIASTLSYGEQQRVSIIRALAQPFQWLLMDEPFSHLDIANREKAINLIADVLQQRKAGMILADLDRNTYFPYTQTLIM